MTSILETPFGAFAGKKGDAVVQYLGIKYASVKDQLSVPELVTSYGNSTVNATEFGSVLLCSGFPFSSFTMRSDQIIAGPKHQRWTAAFSSKMSSYNALLVLLSLHR